MLSFMKPYLRFTENTSTPELMSFVFATHFTSDVFQSETY